MPAAAAEWKGYPQAIVIDGMGSGPDSTRPVSDEYLNDARHSGLTCAVNTIPPIGTTPPDTAFAQVVRGLLERNREVERHSDTLMHIRTTDDILAAKKSQRLGWIHTLQDGVAFETDLSRLTDLYDLGLRIVQPTYNRRNLLGDGCMEPADAGLSLTGAEAIERMNALGILVDLSHCGRRTAADAIRLSKRPVVFTHTGCAALADHPRNRTDEEFRAVSNGGGVSGIYVMPYLSGGRQPTAADVIRHLEHLIDIAGEDHVSIGTDGALSAIVVDDKYKKSFAEVTRERRRLGIAAPQETEDGYLFAAELNTPRRFETLGLMLAKRGHTSTRIEKILGRNLLRVFSETWNTTGS
jgi:membrane dipeptidase